MPGADPDPPAAAPTTGGPAVLGLLGYVIFPTLAVVTAVLGVMLLIEQNLGPALLLFVLLQLWLLGAVLAHLRRRRSLQDQAQNTDDDGRPRAGKLP